MKSFPSMVDMKCDKPMDMMGLVQPSVSDLPDYDYGLNISFNEESLAKLDLGDDVSVGDFVHIHAFAQVTSLSQKPGSDKPDRVCMVLTHIGCEDEDEQQSDEG